MRLLGFIFMYLFCCSAFSWANQGRVKENLNDDTLKAVVSYGDSYLFDRSVGLSDPFLDHMIDSLRKSTNPDIVLLDELLFYKNLQSKDEEQVNTLIDSLFELDSIPYALINEMNLYVSRLPMDYKIPKSFIFIPSDNSPYPANFYYKTWNSSHPFNYPLDLASEDSTIALLLNDSVNNCGYFHPVGTKEGLKYYGHVTSYFGWREGKNHNGVDLELHQWDEVHCMFGGIVRLAKNYAGYGKVVIVRHFNGLETLYAHMNVLKVKTGEEVEAGQVLGLGGSTGNSTGTHLHLEMRFKGLPLNPSHIINFSNRMLHSDTILLKKSRYSYVAYPLGKKQHIVQRGDYIHKIARRYGVSVQYLCELNNISPKERLVLGQAIIIDE